MSFNDFRAGKKLDDVDLPRLGKMINVGEDKIHAVIDVECAGNWRDSQGRLRMLFEPHIFYRELPNDLKQRAQSAGLAYPSWRPGSYPQDSYPRLAQAMAIHETAALKSASWGGPQIMGFNYTSAGYSTVQEMVLDFTRDDDNQLEAMIRFIITNRLDDELRAGNWAAFARGYNGPGYAANKYDIKLAAAYKWWQGKPDTPWDGKHDPSDFPPVAPQEPVVLPPGQPPYSDQLPPFWQFMKLKFKQWF